MLGYEELVGFEHVYLENSFVLDVVVTPAKVSFVVEVVLLESHPDYQPPLSGEQYSYGAFRISFCSVTSVSWSGQGRLAAVDSSGEKDYGGFDEFSPANGSWLIAGDWGEIAITCESSPTIERLEAQ